jgi:hypothetical protein
MRCFVGLILFLTAASAVAEPVRSDIVTYTGIDGAYATVTVVCRTAHSPEAVWSLLGDWANESLGEGFVDRVEITGRDAGALRTSHLQGHLGSGVLVERLEAYDAERRTYAYTLVDSNALPWAGYRGSMSVTKAVSHSVILFEARMVPVGVSHAEAAAMSVRNMQFVCANLEKLLGAE